MKMRAYLFSLVLGIFFLIPPTMVAAQIDEAKQPDSETYEYTSRDFDAKITSIDSPASGEDPMKHYRFRAVGEDGKTYSVDTKESFPEGVWYRLNINDTVQLQEFGAPSDVAYFVDVERTNPLAWIVVLFGVVIMIVGLRRGVQAILGLVVTIGIIGWFVLPNILSGSDPVFICGVAAAAILGVTMHIAHGFNRRTATAFVSTLLGLVTVYGSAVFFVWFAKLSGLGSEDALLLFLHTQTISVPSGLLLGTIILGAAGALDDIAITQTETVAELRAANPTLTQRDLFTRAMRIGRHHIASIVNTLVLAYVSVALPMLLLFLLLPDVTIWQVLNREPIASEIVRTVAGTMGLLLTVPIATALAAYAGVRGGHSDTHSHA